MGDDWMGIPAGRYGSGARIDVYKRQFQVRLKYDVDTVGRMLPYADFRIRPYSLEETLTNVLSPFDYKFVKQSDKVYKLKPYEYARRTDADGEKMLAYLSGLYSDKSQWEQRREILVSYTHLIPCPTAVW